MSNISALMPVYNAERYLADAIRSILCQTYEDFEFVIVDDGSKDRSLEIIQDFARRDGRIRVLSRPNTGIVGALNDGLALCSGQYVARMDADDISMPGRFAVQEEYLRSHPDYVLVGSRVVIVDPDGDELREMGDAFSHEEIEAGLLARKGQLVYHPSVMFRLEAVRRIGGYRHEFPHVEDLDLFLRLAETGRLANLRTPLLKYREHFAKVGFVFRAQQEREINDVLQQAYQRRQISSQPPVSNMDMQAGPSVTDTHRMWAWWALAAGHLRTARKHAIAALKRAPFSLDSWRLMTCVVRGH